MPDQPDAVPVAQIHPPNFASATVDSEPNGSNRAFLFALPITLAFIGLLVGAIWGLIGYLQSPKGFESEAVFSVVHNDPNIRQLVHHVEKIKGHMIIENCLHRDGGKLKNLQSFDNTPKDAIADLVQRNLVVESLTEDGTMISLRFISSNEMDSPTILNNLVQTYEESLRRRASYRRRAELERVRAIVDTFSNNAKSRQRELAEWQSKISSTHDFEESAKRIAGQMSKTRVLIRQKNHLLKQVETAIEGNDEAKEEVIWMLAQRGHLKTGPPTPATMESGTEKVAVGKAPKPSNRDSTTTLKRFASLIRGDIAAMGSDLDEDNEIYQGYNDEALRNFRVSEKVNQLREDIASLTERLIPLQRQVAELGVSYEADPEWDFERIQNAVEGKYTTRTSPDNFSRPMLTGMLSGFFAGFALALILK